MVLTWEAKVVAAADAAADAAEADAAETNWKHEVTPDWSDLIRVQKPKNPIWLPGSHFESDITENQ